jgi:hypothetical protein
MKEAWRIEAAAQSMGEALGRTTRALNKLKYATWLHSFKPQRQPFNLIAALVIALAAAEIVWYVLKIL